MTEIAGWSVKRLSEVIDCSFAGEWGEPQANDKNDIPVLRSTNFTNSGLIDYSNLVVRNIPEKIRLQKALKKGDILLEKSGGSPNQPVGRVVFFENDHAFLFSNFTQKLTPSNGADNKYVFYKLYFEYQNGLVLRYQQQTTGIINFQLAEYLNLKVNFPPHAEQHRIAEILTTVDSAIESTQALLKKLKDFRVGMMQELLTKGIGHTKFKESAIGLIPVTWEAVKLGVIFPKIVVGYVGNVNDYYCSRENGIPFYRTQNIRDGNFTSENIMFVNKEFNDKNKKSQIFNDDILIARVGANLGMTCKVMGLNGVANIANAIIIKSHKNVDSDFYAAYLCSDVVQAKITSEAAGGAQGVFNTGLAQGLIAPLPPVEEQVKISERITAIQSRINVVNARFLKLNNLKKSLMQDLLTGKVRVKVN